MLPFFLLALASATAGLPPALVGADLMTGAPGPVTDAQLRDVHAAKIVPSR